MKRSTLKFEEIILFENDDYILVNKPAFLATLEDRQDPLNLLAMAKRYISTAQVCHRLDKETSGVLAIAKNPEAYRHLSIQFEKRAVNKVYHALVDGIHQASQKLIDAPILKLPDGTVRTSREGKPAQTYFTTLKVYRFHSLMECRPVTGRMHQIRAHLSVLGAPISGDLLYGGKPFFLSHIKRGFNLKKETEEQPLMKRMALHAFSLQFVDINESSIGVEAPYQKDMQALIRQLNISTKGPAGV